MTLYFLSILIIIVTTIIVLFLFADDLNKMYNVRLLISI